MKVDKVSQYTFTKVIIDYLEEQFLRQLCMACYRIANTTKYFLCPLSSLHDSRTVNTVLQRVTGCRESCKYNYCTVVIIIIP